jgi:hypothetical protein
MTQPTQPPLFDAPPSFALPLSKHRDLHFDFLYMPLVVDANGLPILDANGDPQYQVANYPPGAVVTLEIDTSPETTGNATVTGPHAVVEIAYTITDAIKMNVPWRLRLIQGTWDDVVAQGRTTRVDP